MGWWLYSRTSTAIAGTSTRTHCPSRSKAARVPYVAGVLCLMWQNFPVAIILASAPRSGCVKTLTHTEVRASTQNLELIDRLAEPNFTYERCFQPCFTQIKRPKQFYTACAHSGLDSFQMWQAKFSYISENVFFIWSWMNLAPLTSAKNRLSPVLNIMNFRWHHTWAASQNCFPQSDRDWSASPASCAASDNDARTHA